MQQSIVSLVRVQCRRKESSRSLSHLLMSFLLSLEMASSGAFLCKMCVAAGSKTHKLANLRDILAQGMVHPHLLHPLAIRLCVGCYFCRFLRSSFSAIVTKNCRS